jgi:GMP synthase-like glutamine amidotransferase
MYMSDEPEINDSKKIKICIIDNYPYGFPTDRISRLESILNNMIADLEVVTIHFTQLKEEEMEQFSGVILSGSSFNVSSFYYDYKIKDKYQAEIELIRNSSQLPILGICFGHQLIAYAFEAQVCRMRMSAINQGIIFILLNETDEFVNNSNIPVNVHHRDFISPNDVNIINNFKIISTSRTKGYKIIQYMKHKEKPIFSIQFHPETHDAYYFHASLFDEQIVSKTMTIGQKILENFIWGCIYEH